VKNSALAWEPGSSDSTHVTYFFKEKLSLFSMTFTENALTPSLDYFVQCIGYVVRLRRSVMRTWW